MTDTKISKSSEQSTVALYQNIETLLMEARKKVYTQVNTTMVQTYWKRGKLIVEDTQKGKQSAEYGKQVIPNLARQLGLARDFQQVICNE